MAKDRRLPAVDALRAVAALMVVLYHSAIGIHAEPWPLQLVHPIASIGHTGVGLFLVISDVPPKGCPRTAARLFR